jgi:hypothetical protein
VNEQQPTQIGTPAQQSQHRDPAPSPAEHNADFRERHPDECVDDH